MKPTLWFAGGLALGLLIGLPIWEVTRVGPLRAEHALLVERGKESDALRAENARLAGARVDPDELERLREGQAELLRLRGQVSQLRREVQQSRSASATRPVAPLPTTNAPSDESPVDRFTVNVTAHVGWQTTMTTGGWQLPSGKRGFVLLQPSDAGDGTVSVKVHIVELPEAMLAGFGLDRLKAEGKASTGSGRLTTEQTQELIKRLQKPEGAEIRPEDGEILASPQVMVLSGRAAQVSVTEFHTSPSGQTYTTGPTVDITPTISADKLDVELVVIAQLNLPREKQ